MSRTARIIGLAVGIAGITVAASTLILMGSDGGPARASAPPFNLIDESLALSPADHAKFAKGGSKHREVGSKSSNELLRDALDAKVRVAEDGFYEQIAADPKGDAARAEYVKCTGFLSVTKLEDRIHALFVQGDSNAANSLIALDESCQAQLQPQLDGISRGQIAKWKLTNRQLLADFAQAQIAVGSE